MKIIGKCFFIILMAAPPVFSASARENEQAWQAAGAYAVRGNEYSQAGDYANAIADWTKAVELRPDLAAVVNPHLAMAYAKTGAHYYLNGDYGKSLAYFDKALQFQPNGDTRIRRARELAAPQKDLLSEAQKKIQTGRVLIISATVLLLIYLLVVLLPFLKKLPALFTLLFAASPGLPKAQPAAVKASANDAEEKLLADLKAARFYNRVRELMDEGKYEEALRVYSLKKELLTEADKINLFEIHLRMSNHDSVRLLFEDIKESVLLRENSELRQKLSELCREKGQSDLAEEISRAKDKEEIIAGEHGLESLVFLMEKGKYKEALKTLLKKPPKEMTLKDYNLLFEIYLQLEDFTRAGLILSEIEKIITDKYPVERLRGRLFIKRGEIAPKKSLQEITLEKNLPNHYVSLSLLAKTKDRPGFASRLYRLAVDCIFNIVDIKNNQQEYYELAVSLENEGENEFALELYQALNERRAKYLDAEERYKKLKEKAPAKVEPDKLQILAQVRANALKTGTSVSGIVLDDRYELRGGLGEGSMGVVYEAFDRQNNRQVAVKRMHSWLKEYPEEYDRFRSEAKIVERLKHPNIVGLHGVVEQNGDIYLVFDYVVGKTLYDVLKERNWFSLQECKGLFNGICDAVHYAHKSNIIHRDLKLANIMLAGNAKAMVMDFGLASELREGLTRVTHQTTAGTPAYMAPEQHEGIVKREADIYAMGVCLYEMATGELPFKGLDNLKQKKAKIYSEATAIRPLLPTGIDGIISRSLEPEPSQRYADALDFWSALKKL
ncbi:MAG: protein kinase [Elusimicrobia bacterium]|nr:protein kinase [Elusimicrobiota bacterium]